MKPISLMVNETNEKIIEIINQSNLPVYCLKQLVKELLMQIENLEKQEIEEYYKEELSKEKESDK